MLVGYLLSAWVTKCKQTGKHDRTMLCSPKHNYCKSFSFTNTKIHSKLQLNMSTTLYNRLYRLLLRACAGYG